MLPRDLARGAQVYARALADIASAGSDQQHDVVVLFTGPVVAANAEHDLGIRPGRLRQLGLDPRAALGLRRLVRRQAPDVVVAHGAEAMKYVAFARSARSRAVFHSIGVVSPKAMHGVNKALLRALIHRADVLTAVSTAVADQLQSLFELRHDAVRVIPNGRDPARFRGSPTADPAAPPRLIFVGHLTTTKRPEVFVELVAAIRARGCAVEAAMVGDGPQETQLAARAAAAGVELLGRRDDVPVLLQAAGIFVFPSRAEGEGMPGVIIEAGLAGLPVVATDVPGVRDVVVDGETGRVVDVDDLAALTDAAEELARDSALRQAMGTAARVRCTELFSLQASAALFLEELRSVVDRAAPTR